MVSAYQTQSDIALTYVTLSDDHLFSRSRFEFIHTVMEWVNDCAPTPYEQITDHGANSMNGASAEEIQAFFLENFREEKELLPEIILAESGHVIMKAPMSARNTRPGGFISGPTQMFLADHIAYAVIFTQMGITPMVFTSNLNIDFLRPLKGESVMMEGKMIKLGRSLALIAVEIWNDSPEKISSRTTVTYAMPVKP